MAAGRDFIRVVVLVQLRTDSSLGTRQYEPVFEALLVRGCRQFDLCFSVPCRIDDHAFDFHHIVSFAASLSGSNDWPDVASLGRCRTFHTSYLHIPVKSPIQFDYLAPHYHWLERLTFGSMLQSCRVTMLPYVGEVKNVLIVGDGDGRFLCELLKSNPQVQVDSIDISSKMIELAKTRLPAESADRVKFLVADIRQISLPKEHYDLIVTNFLLDCFPADELKLIIERLSQSATPNGKWIVGDFELPNGFWGRAAGRIALAVMYLFFRIVTRIPARGLADPSPDLSRLRWQPVKTFIRLNGFLVSRLWIRQTAP